MKLTDHIVDENLLAAVEKIESASEDENKMTKETIEKRKKDSGIGWKRFFSFVIVMSKLMCPVAMVLMGPSCVVWQKNLKW